MVYVLFLFSLSIRGKKFFWFKLLNALCENIKFYISYFFGFIQGFTYVAPSVLEEMSRPPHIVKARSPRKGPISMRSPYNPRFPHSITGVSSMLNTAEELMEVSGLPNV